MITHHTKNKKKNVSNVHGNDLGGGRGNIVTTPCHGRRAALRHAIILPLLKDFEKINTTILNQHFKFQFDLECVSNCLGTRREQRIYHNQLSKLSTVSMHP